MIRGLRMCVCVLLRWRLGRSKIVKHGYFHPHCCNCPVFNNWQTFVVKTYKRYHHPCVSVEWVYHRQMRRVWPIERTSGHALIRNNSHIFPVGNGVIPTIINTFWTGVTIWSERCLRIGVGLRVGLQLCHKDGRMMDLFGIHPLSCHLNASRSPRHCVENEAIKRSLE